MKKTLKKALAMIMSVSMLGSLAVPVFAEETTQFQQPYTIEELEAMVDGDEIEFKIAQEKMESYFHDLRWAEATTKESNIIEDLFEDICARFDEEHKDGKDIPEMPYTIEELRSSVYYGEEKFYEMYYKAIAYYDLHKICSDEKLQECEYDNDLFSFMYNKFTALHKLETESGAKSTVSKEQVARILELYKLEKEILQKDFDTQVQDRLDFIADGGFENCIIGDSFYSQVDLKDGEWYIQTSFNSTANSPGDGRTKTVRMCWDVKDGVENHRPYLSCFGYGEQPILNRYVNIDGFENYFETKNIDGIDYVTLDGVDYEYYITSDGKHVYCTVPELEFPIFLLGYADEETLSISEEESDEINNIIKENSWIMSLFWYDYLQSDLANFYMYRVGKSGQYNTPYEDFLLEYVLEKNNLLIYSDEYEAGDIDGDGEIEISSLEQLYPKCDMDGDGVEEFIDVDTYLANIDRIENVNLDDRHINLVGESSTEEQSLQSVLESDSSLVKGDVNLDSAIDVLDLGTLKLFVTKQSDFTEVQNYTATGNASTAPDIRNVTRMNQYLIKLVDEY